MVTDDAIAIFFFLGVLIAQMFLPFSIYIKLYLHLL